MTLPEAPEGLPPLPKTSIRLLSDLQSGSEPGYNAEQMHSYALLAVVQERERCAKLCDDAAALWKTQDVAPHEVELIEAFAAVIRKEPQ